MTDSPLQFTREFDRLKASLAVIHTPDTRLLLLANFWPKLKEALEYKSFSSYSDEYFPLILQPVSETDLGDLRIEELRSIIERLSDIAKSGDAEFRTKVQAITRQTAIALAKKLFYIGEIEAGLEVYRNILESRPELESEPCAADLQICPSDEMKEGQTPLRSEISEIERLRQVRENARDSSSELYQLLTSILIEWESILESLTTYGANCLFVEKDGSGQAFRGRMMTLEGNVELFGKSAEKDEISFQNQIKTPDDPFIGVAYDALEAVRRLLSGKKFAPCAADHQIGPSDDIGSRSGFDPPQAAKNPTPPLSDNVGFLVTDKIGDGGTRPTIDRKRRAAKSGPFYHAHFTILNSKQTFTGDSIGLAFALITYTQLLKPEIMRQERFLPSDVAFTGGVDENGRLTTVNEDTLRLKIERAFFSPMKFVVVPNGNFASAKHIIDEFRHKYPRRNLRLISAESLNEILDDRNVIRSERVCAGQYIFRKASRYSRSAKIQIPILLALLYAAVCLIYPKAWVGFDWHIASLHVEPYQISALNSDGHVLWTNNSFTNAMDAEVYKNPIASECLHAIADIDRDGRDELFFVPNNQSLTGRIQLYDDNGKKLWEEPACVQTTYPGDIGYDDYKENVHYFPPDITLLNINKDSIFIISGSFASNPGRAQFLLFNVFGNIISGPYIFTGAAGIFRGISQDFDADYSNDLMICGTNNRYNSAGLAVVNPFKLSGVSPPYDNDLFIKSGMPKGSQIYYITFPETPLSGGQDIRNRFARLQFDKRTHNLLVTIDEGYGLSIGGQTIAKKDLMFPQFIYQLDSNFIPQEMSASDGAIAQYNQLLILIGKKPVYDLSQFFDSLIGEVVVYYGDSVVHHLAAGIDYYK